MARRHKKVIWTNQAYSTLDEAVAYIAQDSLTSALQLLERALSHCRYSMSVAVSFPSYSSRMFENSSCNGTD